MRLNGYQIVNEFLMTYEESPEIKKERTTKLFIYLFHGTPINLIDSIKKEGLLLKKMGSYLNDLYQENLKGKSVIFFTSSKKSAEDYSKSKMPIFKRSNPIALLCKLNVKYLKFLMSSTLLGKRNDEYIYLRDVPIKDIIFPDNPIYSKIIEKEKYLQ